MTQPSSTDGELVAAMLRAMSEQTPANLASLALALGEADGLLLSDHGTPLAPNPRGLTTKDGRKWIVAFSSIDRATRGNTAGDGILRAPMPLICSVAEATPAIAGVLLNPADDPWMLIEGSLLRQVAEMTGSRHPITMVDPRFATTLSVGVRADGTITVDNEPRTLPQLRLALVALQATGGAVQYSRAAPREDPPDSLAAVIDSVLDLIKEFRLPVSFAEEASASELQVARSEATRKSGIFGRLGRR